MIAIPEEIKQLLQDDSTQKNFRVHFPNGERADITNENIVSESVSFTESICSQSTLKFGLCESPYIEFETYGVGKIKGATIECSIEVLYDNEVTSETTQYTGDNIIYYGLNIPDGARFSIHFTENMANALNRVVMHTSDGSGEHTLELSEDKSVASIEWRESYNTETIYGDSNIITVYFSSSFETDNQSYYYTYVAETIYSIPLGTFVVDSCKKQADMTHRRVIAYAKNNINKTEMFSCSEYIKGLMLTKYNASGNYDLLKDIYSYFKADELKFLNRQEWNLSADLCGTTQIISFVGGSQTYNLMLRRYGDSLQTSGSRLHCFEFQGSEATESQVISQLCYQAQTLIQSVGGSYPDLREEVNRTINLIAKNYIHANKVLFEGVINNTADHIVYDYGGSIDKDMLTAIYPYMVTHSRETNNYIIVKIPSSLELSLWVSSTEISAADRVRYEAKPKCYELTSTYDGLFSLSVSRQKQSGKYYISDSLSSDDVKKYYEAICELNGLLGKTNREGGYEFINLKDKLTALYPAETLYPLDTLYPNDNVGDLIGKSFYQTIWYDDDYTLPIGAVKCSYKNGTEDAFQIVYAEGYSEDSDISTFVTYDLSNNQLIKNNTVSDENITTILNTFIANASGISFMPAEVTMVGRPDLEAGDVLEIETSEETITTLVLQRTIKGIQSLVDNIRSV